MTFGRQHIVVALVVLGVALALAACGGSESELPQGSEPVELDPKDLSLEIDNPYCR